LQVTRLMNERAKAGRRTDGVKKGVWGVHFSDHIIIVVVVVVVRLR
jgi:hypothetical protein